jgi:hypothetical protein
MHLVEPLRLVARHLGTRLRLAEDLVDDVVKAVVVAEQRLEPGVSVSESDN